MDKKKLLKYSIVLGVIKKIAIVLFIAYSSSANAQRIKYGEEPQKNFNAKFYQTKSGVILKAGDTIKLGSPMDKSSGTFTYITQGGVRVLRALENNEVVIRKFRTFRQKAFRGKTFVEFGGYGLMPVFVDYEAALENGEIDTGKEPISRSQAIEKLKDAKELLDLQLLTQKEYDSIKAIYAPIIKQ